MAVLTKWTKLSQELHSVPNIKKDRTTPRKLFNAHKARRAFIMELGFTGDETIHVFGALWKTKDKDWFEIGTIWVNKAHQGNGYSKQIVSELLKMAGSLGKSVFLVSKEPSIQKVAKDSGLILTKTPRSSPCSRAIGKKRDLGEGRVVFYHKHTH